MNVAQSPELTAEEREILARGSEYRQLQAQPGWKRILAFLDDAEAQALEEVRNSKSSDPAVTYALVMRWKERSAMAQNVRREVEDGIAERNEWVTQYLESQRVNPAQIEEFIAMEGTSA